jgi:hypothetical protein
MSQSNTNVSHFGVVTYGKRFCHSRGNHNQRIELADENTHFGDRRENQFQSLKEAENYLENVLMNTYTNAKFIIQTKRSGLRSSFTIMPNPDFNEQNSQYFKEYEWKYESDSSNINWQVYEYL